MKQPRQKIVTTPLNSCQRMDTADIASYHNRSIPWVRLAEKKGLIPPAVRIGAPFWILSSVVEWTERLVREAEAKALKAA